MSRTKGILIADFPKSGTFHSMARRIWLGLNRIKLNTISGPGLDRFLRSLGMNFEVKELDLNWMVKIGNSEPQSRDQTAAGNSLSGGDSR